MTEELEHVERPNLPWRQRSLTECGLETDGRPVITREALQKKWKDQGQQRAALTTCMTCLSTAQRWRGWDQRPSEVMKRWMQTSSSSRAWGDASYDEMDLELIAIAALIAEHREEFDTYLAGLSAAPSLDAARRARRRR